MDDEWCEEAAGDLLEAFHQQVPPRPERPPTFMEIFGYPHYENVCSNILAFFFDPSKPHGLGTLFLDALAQIGGITEPDWKIGGNVRVDREEPTDERNRIDLLIQSDAHVILIENKIFHEIANPLEDYIKHAKSHYRQLKPHLFLLTLKPGGDVGRFKNITYEQLVAQIRTLHGDYVAHADIRYLTFMLDFLNTLENLREGWELNAKTAEFLAKDNNLEKARHFFGEIDMYKGELRKTVSELGNGLNDIANDGRVSQGKWREKHGLYDILYHDVEHSDFSDDKIVLNAKIDPRGWSFEMFLRGGQPDSVTLEKFNSLLHKLEIEFQDEYRFTLQKRFSYTCELQEVAAFVRDTVTSIRKSGDGAR
ncbi:MAG: PD-(D/E)XK nuclease family protein [Gemmatimonadota bacterium]|nr:PD-(D/E)XK nuclease family protein [Gemmatimonadota bacterium]